MAGSGRFELNSNNLEGSVINSSYSNGQRGSYAGPSLDRSGSFRESMENRILISGSGTSRGGSVSLELPSLTQSLVLEQYSLGDQKLVRSGELRKVLSTSLGITSEDLAVGGIHSKSLPPAAFEELRRYKAIVVDTSTRARDRAKMLNESISKLDKYRHTLISKKRQRNELSSNERLSSTNMLKMGNQIHQGSDVNQRMEDRAKNSVPNKRARTSVVDVRLEGRSTSLLRQGMTMDKDRDLLRAGNGGSVQVEEKIRGLPAGGDGWDKKMKRRRSMGTVTRTMEGDRELKRGMQQRPNVESRSRPCDGHGFRSGVSNGIIGVNKLDGSCPPTTTARTVSRNDSDNVPLLNDRRERAAGLDKERVLAKNGNKLNLREDSQLGNTSPVTKGKASRAPRTGSVVLANSSSSFSRGGALEGWEQPMSSNKGQVANGTSNRKRHMTAGSSSPPVAWAGQRPHKVSRSRRTNLVSPVSNPDEPPTPSEGFPAPDIGSRLPSTESSGPLLARGVSNNSQQFKLKSENVPSPAGLSESEESGAVENKLKEKGVDNGDVEDRTANTVQKVGPFTMKKNKIYIKEDIVDGVRRQGRSGRGSAQSRGCVPSTREKLENMVTTKPQRNAKPGFDKSESKSGRPPTKKMSDRRAFNRPGKVVNSGSSEFTGESDDDNEELVAAANSARSASFDACSGPFWKTLEPLFASVSLRDITYMKQQISFVEELEEGLRLMVSDSSLTDELVGKATMSSSALSYGDRQGSQPNGVVQNRFSQTITKSHGESWDGDTVHRKLETEKWLEKIIPLSQRLLSAFIVEDEAEDFDYNNDLRYASFQYTSDDSPCGTYSNNDNGDRMESEIESEELRTSKINNLDNFSGDGSTASNGFKSPNMRTLQYNDEPWQEEGVFVHPEVGQNNLDGLHSIYTSSYECQYQQMCLDDRILVELNSIGIFPEAVPDLTEEDEEVNNDISELQKGLFQQVKSQKGQLCNVDRNILKGRDMEERDLEQLSMNKLVEMAYKKYMSCRGSSGKSSVSKVARQVALAFAKRTLARCQKFEESGRSCFSEPALRDVIFSPLVYSSDSKSIDCGQPESRISGAMGAGSAACTTERHASVADKVDRAPPDAYQVVANTPDQTFTKNESTSSRGKKREVLLDDVGVSASRGTASLGTTLMGGSKGKRSERERDQNKDALARGSTAKAGRPSLGNAKGERKNKTKPKQKTAQLSTSGNGLLNRFTETTTVCETVTNSNKVEKEVGNAVKDATKESEEPMDFTNLQLPTFDFMEELDGTDIWSNIDDNLQDHDLVGLEIPMDDLNMIL